MSELRSVAGLDGDSVRMWVDATLQYRAWKADDNFALRKRLRILGQTQPMPELRAW